MKQLIFATAVAILLSGCATIERDVIPTYGAIDTIINVIKVIP